METKITTDNTIVFNYKGKKISGEVDFDVRYDILGEKLADKGFDEDGFHEIEDRSNYYDHPISIKELKKMIKHFEDLGSNYVAIEYNPDHPDYTVIGLEVHKASQEEVDAEIERIELRKTRSAEALRKEAEELIQKAKKLEESKN